MTTNPPTPRALQDHSGRAQQPSSPSAGPDVNTMLGQTLTTFDWLDSCIEQAAALTDLQAAR
ncbi:MAG TPA: hypothetical protein VLJ62_13885, partial [Burkholderiaceae bacterium]|nr:hypothetical protein [Burkholderiaceae bacterium]